jgi:hypothetical protein
MHDTCVDAVRADDSERPMTPARLHIAGGEPMWARLLRRPCRAGESGEIKGIVDARGRARAIGS